MSGFIELTPALKADGTGVKVSLTDRNGLILTIWGEALMALGGGDPGSAKVFLDLDPAFPRLRIERHKDGLFNITSTPKGGGKRLVRIGHQSAIKAPAAKGMACVWEEVENRCAIDIDLPREFFPARTTTTQRQTAVASTSTSTPRTTPVTLPAVGRHA